MAMTIEQIRSNIALLTDELGAIRARLAEIAKFKQSDPLDPQYDQEERGLLVRGAELDVLVGDARKQLAFERRELARAEQQKRLAQETETRNQAAYAVELYQEAAITMLERAIAAHEAIQRHKALVGAINKYQADNSHNPLYLPSPAVRCVDLAFVLTAANKLAAGLKQLGLAK